jgi:Flp pilus assembly CpaE family ATPase
MSVVALLGIKQSPGATTLAVALAALASEHEPLIIEADPIGGDLAARAGMPLDPGMLTLAAAGRRGVSAQLLDAHTQTLANGARVLVAPTSMAHAQAALSGLSTSLTELLRTRPGLVLVDTGRWDARSPSSSDLVRAADVVLALFRPTVEGVEHLRIRLDALRGLDVVPVAVGEHPYRAAEISAALDGAVVHVLANDPRSAATVGVGIPLDRWLRRSAYMRSVAALLGHLTALGTRELAAS